MLRTEPSIEFSKGTRARSASPRSTARIASWIGRRPQRLEARSPAAASRRASSVKVPGRSQIGDPHRRGSLFEGDRVAGFVVFGDLLAGHGLDVTSSVTSPFGAGVSGIDTVSVSPAPML